MSGADRTSYGGGIDRTFLAVPSPRVQRSQLTYKTVSPTMPKSQQAKVNKAGERRGGRTATHAVFGDPYWAMMERVIVCNSKYYKLPEQWHALVDMLRVEKSVAAIPISNGRHR